MPVYRQHGGSGGIESTSLKSVHQDDLVGINDFVDILEAQLSFSESGRPQDLCSYSSTGEHVVRNIQIHAK